MKRNHFKDKNARYQCTKRRKKKKKCLISFLLQCIKSKLIPKGLKPELEPTIGNCDQEFLDLWYSNLQEFSLVLMEGILKFYDKTIGTAWQINLRILTGKKHCQVKLQHLQKVRTWAFGSLQHINSLWVS